jgi:nicotinamidase-related amidase
MRDVLLIVDVLGDFSHEDGEELLASLGERHEALVEVLAAAREADVPVVYANDSKGTWDGDARSLVERALATPGGWLVRDLLPQPGERFVIKPRYSRSTTRRSTSSSGSSGASGSSSSG